MKHLIPFLGQMEVEQTETDERAMGWQSVEIKVEPPDEEPVYYSGEQLEANHNLKNEIKEVTRVTRSVQQENEVLRKKLSELLEKDARLTMQGRDRWRKVNRYKKKLFQEKLEIYKLRKRIRHLVLPKEQQSRRELFTNTTLPDKPLSSTSTVTGSPKHCRNIQSGENSTENIFQCKECPSNFRRLTLLQRHTLAVHQNPKRTKPYFPRNAAAAQRVVNVTPVARSPDFKVIKGKLFPCSHCTKSFNRVSVLKKHLHCAHNILDSVTDFIGCGRCGETFATRTLHYNHRITVQ